MILTRYCLHISTGLLCLLPFFSNAQSDYLGLTGIDHGHARYSWNETDKRSPTIIKADAKGGTIETYLKLDKGCVESYRFTWTFDQDVNKILLGKEITGTITAQRIKGDCYNNGAYITISGSNNGSTMLNDTRSGYGSISAYGDRAHAVNSNNTNQSNPFEIKIGGAYVANEGYFTIRIATTTDASNKDVFDYEIRYNYQKNYAATGGGGAINCFALYDFGVNIGLLEYGSLKNDSPSFLVGFIDNAITVIKGIGCLSTSYLEDLKVRMMGASSSKGFNIEISNYRQRLPAIIQAECK